MSKIPPQFTTEPNDRPAPTWERPGLYWNPAYLRYIERRDRAERRSHGAVRVQQAPPPPVNPFRARKERGVA